MKSPEHKKIILNRSLRRWRHKPGVWVKTNKTNKYGVIKAIIDDIEQVDWTSDKPHFILVDFDGVETLCSRNEIQKVNENEALRNRKA